MSDRIPVTRPRFIWLLNRAIRRHKKYRNGMMVEMVPYEVRPEGYSVVCKIPDVQEVVTEAAAELQRKYSKIQPSAGNAGKYLLTRSENAMRITTAEHHDPTGI